MKDRPILFSGPMVRAILAGVKTQTRRPMKHQPEIRPSGIWFTSTGKAFLRQIGGRTYTDTELLSGLVREFNPYGKPGDRLWVRETWALGRATQDITAPMFGPHKVVRKGTVRPVIYRAKELVNDSEWKWTASIHMPRWASRITLENVSIRVERVQDISPTDAMAEGVGSTCLGHARPDFNCLWDSTYAKRGLGWDVNPWVWVIEFKRI